MLGIIGTLIGLMALGSMLSDDEPALLAGGTTTANKTETKPQPKTKPKPVPKRYGQLLVKGMTAQKAAGPLCSQYRDSIDSWTADAKRYLAASATAANDPEGYAAVDYLANSGEFNGKTPDQFQDHLAQLALKRLKAVTRPRITETMLETFTEDSLFICHLGAAAQDTKEKLEAAMNRNDQIVSSANSVPWYPRGWKEVADGIAVDYIENHDCGYSDAYCWGYYVISREGCPSGIYVEVNITNSEGTVVDYSNDTLGSLPAGQRGQLEFQAFQEDAGTLGATITDTSCY